MNLVGSSVVDTKGCDVLPVSAPLTFNTAGGPPRGHAWRWVSKSSAQRHTHTARESCRHTRGTVDRPTLHGYIPSFGNQIGARDRAPSKRGGRPVWRHHQLPCNWAVAARQVRRCHPTQLSPARQLQCIMMRLMRMMAVLTTSSQLLWARPRSAGPEPAGRMMHREGMADELNKNAGRCANWAWVHVGDGGLVESR